MKIGLIDVDSHNFPNLCLMKLSAYHKAQGDKVDWWNGFEQYDRIYMSKVFTEEYTPDMPEPYNGEVIMGGTGYGLDNTLPDYDITNVVFSDDYMVFNKQNNDINDLGIRYADVYGILAAPPCTEFSILNCTAENRQRDFSAGMVVVKACMRIIEQCKPKFWAMENPRGHLRSFMQDRPRLTFQPWWYGDPWTKCTDIWGNFTLPEKMYAKWEDVPKLPLYTRPGRGKPNFAFLHKAAQKDIPQLQGFAAENDAAFRAITPPGFAQAFYRANK